MRKRRSPWAIVHFLIGLVCALVSVSTAAYATRVDDLIPIVLCGVPGLVLTVRAPIYGVSFGPAGLKYSGLLRARSYTWSEVERVEHAKAAGTLFSSDLPELVLADGRTDQLPLLAGYGFSSKANRRVESLVADMERARAAASPSPA
ncbi:hypothetical protein [Streptomyces sp. FH025]|uniref:hypothetical protein n=1 Tax=Streptomyces sp. FH025 TaxID=2815937 RepID=UPI001A9F7662|nr:hypothetical protein [Streptomyces sp. FH025]MBO1414661.1 hypothetical protein [Streptomyces sp. FH025]